MTTEPYAENDRRQITIFEHKRDHNVPPMFLTSGSCQWCRDDRELPPSPTSEVCPSCLRPVGESDFGAPCTPVDCWYRAALIDGTPRHD